MPKFFWFIFTFIVLQRLFELVIAKGNEKWMLERGGIIRGNDHYKWFIVVHTIFFFSILIEVAIRYYTDFVISPFVFTLFALTQLFRVWCVLSLGRFWNTKIIILPNQPLVVKGPYKYLKHPNYLLVGVELFVIPLLFGAYITAVLFPLLHVLLMRVRIPLENQALSEVKKGLE